MTLQALIQKLDELDRKVESGTYTKEEVTWLIEELGEQAATNQDLAEVFLAAYHSGIRDANRDKGFNVMTLDEYQVEAARTAPVGRDDNEDAFNRLIATIGLAGEVGEVVEIVKKVEGHGHDLDKVKLRGELGDVLWYLSSVASAYGISLGECATNNIAKLRTRYPNGFSSNESRNRAV